MPLANFKDNWFIDNWFIDNGGGGEKEGNKGGKEEKDEKTMERIIRGKRRKIRDKK